MKNNEKIADINDIFERIKRVLKVGTYKGMLENLGIKRGTFDNWKQRGHIPMSQLIVISNKLNVDLEWLMYGDEVISGDDAEDISYVSDISTPYQAKDSISIPYYPEVYASAGGGAMVYDSLTGTEPMQLSRAFVEDFLGVKFSKHLHVINVKGDSMSPTIIDGELLFVAPINGDGVVDGHIYVIMHEDDIYVKRIRKVPFTKRFNLSSDNPDVGDIELTDDQTAACKVIGEVVGQMRRKG